ncbi:MAG: exodeoxyribonuclease VII large subunit [Roseiflexaceae bacterium]
MRIMTVAQLALYLRELFDSDEIVRDLWIEGEVSNFNRHSSGHCYFTLKDGEAQLSAACWRSSVARIGQMPGNGDAVLAHGRVSFYEGRGQIQFYVDDIRAAGIGVLQAQFERMKARLEAEGLFDPSRKRPIPVMPHRIGIVTSPTGAAYQDMLHVLARRFPLAEVILSPCQVQGAGSAESVVEALYALYELPVDLIIVARGGGSIEDLWTFNEEVVARAAFASPVPLISGVGHETDTTMIDYVADLRAPTPSAAAELATPDRAELFEALSYTRERLDLAVEAILGEAQAALEQAQRRLVVRSPAAQISRDRQLLDEWSQRIETRVGHQIDLRRARLDGMVAKLHALNPTAILARGYALVRRADGTIVQEAAQLQAGDLVDVHVRDGSFVARVE